METSKVLVIRKPDGTVHAVPLANKAVIMSHNNRLPEAERSTFEEMDESVAKQLPYIDPNFKTPAETKEYAKKLAEENEVKDTKIKELEAKIAALNVPPAKK